MVSEVMPGPSFGPGGQEGSKTQAHSLLVSDPPAPGDALDFWAKDHEQLPQWHVVHGL